MDSEDWAPPIMNLGRFRFVVGNSSVRQSPPDHQCKATTQLYPLARLILTTLFSPTPFATPRAWVTCQDALPKANSDLLAPYSDACESHSMRGTPRPRADTIATSPPRAHDPISRALSTLTAPTLPPPWATRSAKMEHLPLPRRPRSIACAVRSPTFRACTPHLHCGILVTVGVAVPPGGPRLHRLLDDAALRLLHHCCE